MKYKLTKESKQCYGRTLYRIKALKDFYNVKSGDLGGWVEKEENLSQEGDCWIYYEGKVFGNAEVYASAIVFNNAEVSGNARVCGYAQVFGDARVSDTTIVHDNARVYDNARVFGNARVFNNPRIFGNARVSGNARIFGNMILHKDIKISSNDQIKSIDGFQHPITITKDWIFIGCQNFTLDWLDKSDNEIFKKFKGQGYTLEDIKDIKILIRTVNKINTPKSLLGKLWKILGL